METVYNVEIKQNGKWWYNCQTGDLRQAIHVARQYKGIEVPVRIRKVEKIVVWSMKNGKERTYKYRNRTK